MTPTVGMLVCPKCRAEMITYERSGIHVDQCVSCRGLFLDRGEVERIVDAEAAATLPARLGPEYLEPPRWRDPGPHPMRDQGWDPRPGREGALDPHLDDDDDDDDDRRERGRGRRGRRRGFLGDLFEGLID